ncbi:hypothetical protein M3Y94_00624200 [Aphelenchoides besseyi]|nr:hypothetical protein M3Y94_00624200 [Aphelenchoides besseyi]KAI6218957.1 hypothetical protein M3Y95_01143400 [Aphelenchoides besseyi]
MNSLLLESSRLNMFSRLTVDGRYLFLRSDDKLQILDIFHSKTRSFNLQFGPKITIDGNSHWWLGDKPKLHEFYPIDINTVLAVLRLNGVHYLGVGRIDYEHSVVLIKRTVSTNNRIFLNSWLPLSYPANLNDGVLCREGINRTWEGRYFAFPCGDESKLQNSAYMKHLLVDEPFAYEDGVCYNLSFFLNHTIDLPEVPVMHVELERINVLTGKKTIKPTKNWEEMVDLMNLDVINPFTTVAVGKRLFKSVALKSKDKNSIFMLDTDSLEWRKMISFNRRHISYTSDGTKTLIARVRSNPESANIFKFYRFVFEPEKLSTLVWLRLKRIFDARPSAYEFILSKVPATLHLKHTPL